MNVTLNIEAASFAIPEVLLISFLHLLPGMILVSESIKVM